MSEDNKKFYVRGLEGVAAGETKISYVDGVNGILVYSGYNIHEIADKASFEEVVYLLWYDKLPNKQELEQFRKHLIGEMVLPDSVIKIIEELPKNAHPMAVLRTAVSALGALDPEAENLGVEELNKNSYRLLGRIMASVAAMHRIHNDQPVLEPNIEVKSVSKNFLYLFTGNWPEEDEAQAFNSLLVLHADHGFNASTFAARVTTSTLADIYSALTSAISTLKGPLHGGANQKVMEMLLDIGNINRVEEYINTMLNDKKRIMGFGHRIYKVEDPRAKHLRIWAEKLSTKKGSSHLFQMANKIEEIVIRRKGIYPNVDFYSAIVQHALGIPKEYYTTIFAAARTAGWIAHIREQREDNRLIRPTSRYEGALDKKYVPIEERE